ncbi:MAG: TIGR03663 family protein [Candidatus Berkelbacteria bacterium]|nr:TIGR03663 family protein [Candidatus Berkelbacteria bacterium]
MKYLKDLKKNKFTIICVLIFLLLILSRFLFLSNRPVHHDEGMLSYFAYQIIKEYSYTYTPQIHGPVLFYFQALAFKIFGSETAIVRFSPALFGVLLGFVPLFFKKALGKSKAIVISLLILASPILMFYSRFLVHTALSAVFMLVFVLFVWQFFKKFNANFLFYAAAALAFSFGTSETTYIFCAIFILFLLPFYIFARKDFAKYLKKFIAFFKSNYPDFVSAFLIFILIWMALYSFGFTNSEGLRFSYPNPFDKATGVGFWVSQHKVHLGGQPWFYYLMLGSIYEFLPFIAAIFAIINFKKSKSVFYLFLVWWAATSTIAFAWAGEKFPWLFLPSLLPIIFLGGYYIGENWSRFRDISKISWVILYVFTLFVAFRLCFINPADTNELAVYVQTPNSFAQIENEIKNACRDTNSTDCVVVDSKIQWPMAWDFKDIGHLDSLENSEFSAQTKYVIVSSEKSGEFKPKNFESVRVERLRDWWVPDKCRKIDCVSKFTKYFFTRSTWNPKGGYDVSVYKMKQD